MKDFAAIDFEMANECRSSVRSDGYNLKHHHHALADAEACARITLEILDF